MCVRERKSEREKERKRNREKQTHRQTDGKPEDAQTHRM